MTVRTLAAAIDQGRRAGLALVAAGTLLAVAAGCSMQLETGYAYRPLNATATQRRAYYAPAFSPEKMAAQQEKGGGGNAGPALGAGNGR